MREIRFRGKRIDTGEWVYGWLCSDQSKTPSSGYMIKEYGKHWADVVPETVGQFTDLRVCLEGQEIYEGDWCRFTRRGLTFETHQGVVKFCGTGFKAVIDNEDDAINLDRYYEIEVIGNIFDNPELLGGQR
jgi:hypothetical protein